MCTGAPAGLKKIEQRLTMFLKKVGHWTSLATHRDVSLQRNHPEQSNSRNTYSRNIYHLKVKSGFG